MQTFLPFPDFTKSAKVLDVKRLGKQRVEAYQIMLANRDEWALRDYRTHKGHDPNPKAWSSHPVTILWFPYPQALRSYYNAMLAEWVRRGYNNSMRFAPSGGKELVDWLDESFCQRHRELLISKDREFYSEKFGQIV